MNMARGFYSVVQYCPDRFRGEAVNVGLVLLSTEPHAVRVRMASNFDRVRKLFAMGKPELKDLRLSAQGFIRRIELIAGELRTSEDLAAFAASRANDLRLIEPRLAKLSNIDGDLDRLFAQLVESHSTVKPAENTPAELLPPRLGEVFSRLQQVGKIWQPGIISVPVYKRELDIPYAYKNGVVNLVKPHIFPANKWAESQAAMFTVNGQLIQRHLINGEQHQLIVVSTRENVEQAREIDDHVAPMFRDLGVRLIRPQEVDGFAEEVEASAH